MNSHSFPWIAWPYLPGPLEDGRGCWLCNQKWPDFLCIVSSSTGCIHRWRCWASFSFFFSSVWFDPHLSDLNNQNKNLNVTFGLIYGFIWLIILHQRLSAALWLMNYNYGMRCTQMWPKKVKECGVLCVHVSCHGALDDSHSDTRVAWMGRGVQFPLLPNISQTLSSLCFCPRSLGWNASWERIQRMNDAGKWHLWDMTGSAWEHCWCLSGAASGKWLLETGSLTR